MTETSDARPSDLQGKIIRDEKNSKEMLITLIFKYSRLFS